MIECFFDGAVQPFNPGGHGGYGMLVRVDGQIVFSEAVYIGRWAELSNNVSEYCGAIGALRYLIREGIAEAVVYGDADIVTNQLNGRWKAKRGAYIPYYHEAAALKLKLPKVVFQWIPREMNNDADELSKQAVCQRPRIVSFALDPAIAPHSFNATIKKRKRTRDIRNQPVLSLEIDDEAIIEQFKTEYGASRPTKGSPF